jgi:glutamate 5-kinase
VVEGMSRLGWKRRPEALYELQAAAAVGQMGIARVYEQCFHKHQIHTAQILLTHDDVSDRSRYLNARSTLRQLLALGVVPVVNENDTISTEAIMLGDNDTLAGLVSNLVEADVFIILTDQPGLLSVDPRENPDAKLISQGQAGDPELEKMAGEGGEFGRGGMLTKLKAAALAARSGTTTVIASGLEPNVLLRLARAEPLGTLLEPASVPLAARKQWLAGQFKIRRRGQGAANIGQEPALGRRSRRRGPVQSR